MFHFKNSERNPKLGNDTANNDTATTVHVIENYFTEASIQARQAEKVQAAQAELQLLQEMPVILKMMLRKELVALKPRPESPPMDIPQNKEKNVAIVKKKNSGAKPYKAYTADHMRYAFSGDFTVDIILPLIRLPRARATTPLVTFYFTSLQDSSDSLSSLLTTSVDEEANDPELEQLYNPQFDLTI